MRNFLLWDFCSLGICVRFRVLNSCCDFSCFWGRIVDVEGGGDVNKRCLYERYKPWLEVFSSSEVASHKPSLQCLWSWNCSHLLMPTLVHNLLDLASVLRMTHYLKVSISLLEGIHIVGWLFQLLNIESRCKINWKLKGLDRVSLDVYVPPLVHPNLESRKCMRFVDLNFVFDSQPTLECIVEHIEIQRSYPSWWLKPTTATTCWL